jgi:hypothetical protein
MGERKLTKRSLYAMRARWEGDLKRIEELAGYTAAELGEGESPLAETIRNLATAIAHIDGIAASRAIFPDRSGPGWPTASG